MTTHVLRVICNDQKGIIYSLTKVLYENGLNILKNDEYVDEHGNQFFMRSEVSGEIADVQKLEKEIQAALPANSEVALFSKKKKNVIILATKEFHCIGDLLLRNHYGALDTNILGVVSNHEILQPLVEKFDIPFHFITHKGKSREKHEAEVLELLADYSIDFLVLAKYMRILNPTFVEAYKHRIINIHHSFLPAFIGAKPYHQAYERGVKIIGATAHFVTDNLDEGPIIFQDIIKVNHNYSASDMAKAGRDVEQIVLAKALRLVFNDRVFINGNKTIIF